MESFDFPSDDVWSPSLREHIFPDYDIGSSWHLNGRNTFNNPPHPILPLPLSNPPSRPTLLQQQRTDNTGASNSSFFNLDRYAPAERKRSHLDPPNFPLATVPTGAPSNSSGRPPPASSNQQPHTRIPSPPPIRDSPISVVPGHDPPSIIPRSSHSPLFTSSSSTFDTDRSDTPWADSDADNLNDFVDLTQDSSPPSMPQTARRTPRRSHHRTPANRSQHHSRDPSEPLLNPAKRRRTGNETSQQSKKSQTIEEVDLVDVDADDGLSKVLEQQRVATIKAQQEQAGKPVKLSTLQCIICMENMKDLTATHCGESESTLP